MVKPKTRKASTQCWKDWAPRGGKRRGTCCCNCRSHRALFSHPWVDGKTSHRVGWACCVDGFGRYRATLSNRHGLCEMHEPRVEANKEEKP